MSHSSVLLLVSLACMGMTPQSAVTQVPAFRAMTEMLPLDVSVQDENGRFVPGLQRDDFVVTVNGQVAEVSVFDIEPRPISMVVMVDSSLSVSSFSVNRQTDARVPYYRALLQLVAALGDRDRVQIGSFGLRIAINPTWTRDSAEVERILLEEMWGGGGSPVWQALGEAISLLEPETGRRVVVVFTDGVDTGNTIAGHGSADAVRRQASEAGVVLYAIRPPSVRQPLANRMKELVTAVGGGSFEPTTAEGAGNAIRLLTEELRHQYALGISLKGGTTIRTVNVSLRGGRFTPTLHGSSRRFMTGANRR